MGSSEGVDVCTEDYESISGRRGGRHGAGCCSWRWWSERRSGEESVRTTARPTPIARTSLPWVGVQLVSPLHSLLRGGQFKVCFQRLSDSNSMTGTEAPHQCPAIQHLQPSEIGAYPVGGHSPGCY